MNEWLQNKHARYRNVSIINQEGFEYLLGTFQGDGHLCKGSIGWTIDKRNNIYVENMISTIKDTFTNIHPKIRHQKTNITNIFIHSIIVNKLYSKYKDNGIWSIPKILHYPKSYLSGIIDTDGSIVIKGNRAICTITQKEKSNILLLKELFDSLDISYKLNLDYRYNNYLGNFYRSEITIGNRDNIEKILEFPFKNPNRISKINLIKDLYTNSKRKRPDGILDELITKSLLDGPKTQKELMLELNLTSGNLCYKLERMNKVSRHKSNGKFIYYLK